MNTSPNNVNGNFNWKKIGIILILTFFLGFIIFSVYQSFAEQRKNSEKQAQALENQLNQLNQDLISLKSKYTSMEQNRDSLQEWVDYFNPMKAIIQNAKLRDKVFETLDLKPGDIAKYKVDSTTVLIVEYRVGGNDYNYHMHYLVRNRKGELVEVSPNELFR
jgi:hypothetical protein